MLQIDRVVPKAISVFLLLFGCAVAKADVYNRQMVPLGESEAFMANTGTGDSRDTGAVYFNPAGLAFVESDQVSVSGSVYIQTDYKVNSILEVDGKSLPYESKNFSSIPSTYVASLRRGNWHYALSALVPESSATESVISFSSPSIALSETVVAQSNDLWLGMTAARKLSDTWSVGFTLFGISHSESILGGTILNSIPTNSTVSNNFHDSINAYGLSLVAGIRAQLSEAMSMGFRLQSPFLQLLGGAKSYHSTLTTVPGSPNSQSTQDQSDLEGRYRLPLDMTLGTAWRTSEALRLLLDISFQNGVSYVGIPGINLDVTQTSPTFRYNSGAELTIWEGFPIRMGIFYNPSAIHNFSSDQTGQGKLDFLGTTFGVAKVGEHVRTGVGFFYAFGSGDYQYVANQNLSQTKVYARIYGGLLTSSYAF